MTVFGSNHTLRYCICTTAAMLGLIVAPAFGSTIFVTNTNDSGRGSLALVNSTVSSNETDKADPGRTIRGVGYGGGILNDEGTLTLTNSTCGHTRAYSSYPHAMPTPAKRVHMRSYRSFVITGGV